MSDPGSLLDVPKGTVLSAELLDAMLAQDLSREQIVALIKAALPKAKKRGRPSKTKTAESGPTALQILMEKLDEDHARLVISHRAKQRNALSADAARLLADKFAEVADPNAAADMMIERGWRNFEPAWFEAARQKAAPPKAQRPVSALQQMNARVRHG